MPRARCHPAGPPGSLSLPRLAAEPGPRVLRSGFSAPPYRDPTRLPRIQSTIGDQSSRLDHWPASRRRRHRGLTSALRPPLAVAPLREVNDGRPRPGLSPSCRWAMPSSWSLAAFSWTHRRDASNPLLQPTFHVTSTRRKHPLRLPPWKPKASTLGWHPLRSPAPVGRRGQALHVLIEVREPRLDPSPHRFRGRLVAACASTTSADRCFNEHDDGPLEHPLPRQAAGMAAIVDRSLPFDQRLPSVARPSEDVSDARPG